MASPLVETKLYIPKVRRALVARPRLSERLGRGASSTLMLISAPAGFGKTTLLAQWLATAGNGRSVAWLSLEESDSRPVVFWTGVIAALQTVLPGVGASVLPLLQAAQPPVETVLATVVNELAATVGEVDLVLDDYHLVDGDELRAGMAFLLEHLPAHVHVIVSTRADPLLPLARLRARGELVEVRAADLRFTLEEVAAYLNDVIGLDLAAHDVATLEGRTEGWIAALQLAALSMEGRDDLPGFIEGFAGDDRYIVDYLVEEVLQRQTHAVRTFLLETCLLDRLSGPLCDAVTEQRGGTTMLESLDRGNLFVVPLDDSRHWYRYHHLFADVLQAHLLAERGGDVAALHRRASRWYEGAAEPAQAVRHALAAGDTERAADLVEVAIPGMLQSRQEATIRGWLDAIPDALVRARPMLAVGLIGALMSTGEFDGVDARLRSVERLLDLPTDDRGAGPGPPVNLVAADERTLPSLPGMVQMYRAALALVHGDVPATLRHAQLAVEQAVDDDHLTRAGASAISGLAFWGLGDLEAAHRAYSACVEGLDRAGNISDVLGASIALADIRTTQGRLTDALRTFERALALASRQPGTALRGTPDAHVGMSQIALERDDLAAAAEHLRHSRDLGEHLGLPQHAYRWRVAMAQLLQAQGDLTGPLALVDEAERLYVSDFHPNVRPVPAVRARLLAAQGRVGEALGWAREHGLSPADELSYLREFEHLTLARVLLTRYAVERDTASLPDATRLLERLLYAAEAGERTGSVIETLVLLALAHRAAGDAAGAAAALDRALTLAEPEGYVRVFVSHGAPMTELLRAAARRGSAPSQVRRLLGAGGTQGDAAVGRSLVEPLSERELDVLRLLATDLSGPDIARRLTVSLNTVRTHTKSIYAKLGVNNRRAAVRQAQELDLLSIARGH